MRLVIAAILLAVMGAAATEEHSVLPTELQAVVNEPDKWVKVIEAKLESSLGYEYPNWELNSKAAQRQLFSITSDPIVVLYFGGPCPAALDEVDRLSSNGWGVSEGRLVTVLKNEATYRQKPVRRALRRKPDVYYLETWDTDGIENYLRVYPTYLIIDSDRQLVAIKVGGGDWHRQETGGDD